jgi:hypothetical protein
MYTVQCHGLPSRREPLAHLGIFLRWHRGGEDRNRFAWPEFARLAIWESIGRSFAPGVGTLGTIQAILWGKLHALGNESLACENASRAAAPQGDQREGELARASSRREGELHQQRQWQRQAAGVDWRCIN